MRIRYIILFLLLLTAISFSQSKITSLAIPQFEFEKSEFDEKINIKATRLSSNVWNFELIIDNEIMNEINSCSRNRACLENLNDTFPFKNGTGFADRWLNDDYKFYPLTNLTKNVKALSLTTDISKGSNNITIHFPRGFKENEILRFGYNTIIVNTAISNEIIVNGVSSATSEFEPEIVNTTSIFISTHASEVQQIRKNVLMCSLVNNSAVSCEKTTPEENSRAIYSILNFTEGIIAEHITLVPPTTAAIQNVTINAVNTSRSIIIPHGSLVNTEDITDESFILYRFVSSSEVSFETETTHPNLNEISFSVVEFENATVTVLNYTMSSSTTSLTLSFPAVNLSRSFFINTWKIPNPSGEQDPRSHLLNSFFSNSSEIIINRNTATATATGSIQLLQFTDDRQTVHSGVLNISGSTQTVTGTIPLVNLSSSIAFSPNAAFNGLSTGSIDSSSSDGAFGGSFTFNLTSNTTVEADRDRTGSSSSVTFFVVEFSGGITPIIAPVINILSPTNTTFTSENISLEVDSDQNDLITNWFWSLDFGTTNNSFTPNTTFDTAANGSFQLFVFANNTDNVFGSATVNFSVNTTPVGDAQFDVLAPINITYPTQFLAVITNNSQNVATNFTGRLTGVSLDTTFTFVQNVTIDTLLNGTFELNITANNSVGVSTNFSVDFSVGPTLVNETIVIVIVVTPTFTNETSDRELTCTETSIQDCDLILFSGVEFIDVNGTFINIRIADSLIDAWLQRPVDNDTVHIINISSLNFTQVTFNLTFTGNASDFGYPVSSGVIEIPFVIFEPRFNATTLTSFETQIHLNLSFNESNPNRLFTFNNRTPLGLRYQFGSASTTVILQDADTENLQDAGIQEQVPNTNFGNATALFVQNSEIANRSRIYVTFNITAVPVIAIVNSSNFTLVIFTAPNASRNLSIHQVFDQSWNNTNESTITWNNQPCGTEFTIAANCNLTPADTIAAGNITGNISFDVTRIVQNAHSAGLPNVSFVIRDANESIGQSGFYEFRSGDFSADISQRPILNITFTQVIIQTVDITTEIAIVFGLTALIAILLFMAINFRSLGDGKVSRLIGPTFNLLFFMFALILTVQLSAVLIELANVAGLTNVVTLLDSVSALIIYGGGLLFFIYFIFSLKNFFESIPKAFDKGRGK